MWRAASHQRGNVTRLARYEEVLALFMRDLVFLMISRNRPDRQSLFSSLE